LDENHLSNQSDLRSHLRPLNELMCIACSANNHFSTRNSYQPAFCCHVNIWYCARSPKYRIWYKSLMWPVKLSLVGLWDQKNPKI